MTLVNTAILSFIATAIRMLTGLVINKVLSIYIGPTGLALVGQLQNFSQLAMTAAQGGINSGVTKYAAEYGRDKERIAILFSTAGRISLFSSIFVGVMILIFANYASLKILNSENYNYIFLIFGLTIVLFVANSLLLSILNGLKEIKTWVKINIIQSIYSLFFTTSLIILLGLDGALIALVTNQSVIFIIMLWLLRKNQFINVSSFKKAFDKPEAKKLGAFALMAITSAATIPFSHLVIRNYIGENLGWNKAGYWQAIWYISAMYLMIISTALSTYYLPKLSEITNKKELRKEILQGYTFIMPAVIGMSFLIFLCRDFIIWMLFTEDFSPMRELFLWQLVGDVMKMAAWLVGYLMIAKAMTKKFIITEIIFGFGFMILTIFFVRHYGLIGASYSFAMSYTFYFILIIYVTKTEWGGT